MRAIAAIRPGAEAPLPGNASITRIEAQRAQSPRLAYVRWAASGDRESVPLAERARGAAEREVRPRRGRICARALPSAR